MPEAGFDGHRDRTLEIAAAALAILEAQRRERAAALQESIEGSGGNYLKAVLWQATDRGHVAPLHVLVYLFEPGEEGERTAAAWLDEARMRHGDALRVSVWAPCAHALRWVPVIGVPTAVKKAGSLVAERSRVRADAREEAAA